MDWQSNYLTFKSRSALGSIEANEKRQQLFSKFLVEGLPSKKQDAWKFTSLNGFKEIEWKTVDENEQHLSHEQMQEVSKQLPSEFINFVFVNGILNQTLSDDTDGLLEILDISAEDLAYDEQNVEKNLLNLARAFLDKKIYLSLPAHKVIDKPVQLVFVQSSKNSVYTSDKIEVRLSENSEMSLLVHSLSFVNTTADAMNLQLDIKLESSARLSLVQLQNEDQDSFHFSQVSVEQARNSQFCSLAFTLGNRLTRNYLHLKFLESAAEAEVYGLGVIDNSQHVDNYTFLQHSTGGNNSIQHYKSILSGSAHSVFRGRVLIEPDAQKANSEQLNNNLLLTRAAQADSVPQLEIFADDVKAGHGSTVGQLNKEEIFYFLSRGINQYEAVKMLSYGYAQELVYKLSSELLQKYLITALNKKLEQMVQNA